MPNLYLIILVLLYPFTTVYSAETQSCPNQFIKKFQLINFPLQIQCDENSVEFKLEKALEFIEKTKLNSLRESMDELFRPSYNFKNWHEFIRQSVKEFEYVDRCGGENVIAFVKSDIKDKISLCANQINDERFSVFDFIAAIIHETRHFTGPGHTECSHGPLSQQIACDESITQQGSYAYSAWTYIQLAFGVENVHPVVRLMARANAEVILQAHFNQTPRIEIDKTLVAMTEHGQLLQVNKMNIKSLVKEPVPVGSIYIINNYWYSVSMKNYQIQSIFNPFMGIKQISTLVQDDLNYSLIDLKKKLIDFYRFENNVGLLEANQLTLICPKKNFELKRKNLISFIVSDRAHSNKFQLLRKDGYIETFYCDEGRFDSTPYDSDAGKETIKIIKIGDREYALHLQGLLYSRQRQVEGGYTAWSLIDTNGQKVVSIQVYDSKKFLDQLQYSTEKQQD